MDKDKIKLLQTLRKQKVAIDAEIKDRREAWELETGDIFSDRDILGTTIARIEAELKAQRVEEYDGKDKSKVFGVGIREVTKLYYNPFDAFGWAVEHRIALQLDRRGFEKIAKVDPPDFVTIATEAQATIATDLSDWADENIEKLPF